MEFYFNIKYWIIIFCFVGIGLLLFYQYFIWFIDLIDGYHNVPDIYLWMIPFWIIIVGIKKLIKIIFEKKNEFV